MNNVMNNHTFQSYNHPHFHHTMASQSHRLES